MRLGVAYWIHVRDAVNIAICNLKKSVRKIMNGRIIDAPSGCVNFGPVRSTVPNPCSSFWSVYWNVYIIGSASSVTGIGRHGLRY